MKKKVSVLIGHVFCGSAENANIPLSCAWIAVSAIGFSSFPVFLCLECFYFGFCSKFGEFFAIFFSTCSALPPRPVFAHRRTVHLTVEDDMTNNVLQIIRSLPDFEGDITGVVLQFGGKCIDITLHNPEVAARLALSGFGYENIRKPHRLLGEKLIHVLVFVPVQFPDDTVFDLLKQYGDLKCETLPRLYSQEEGFEHIERGICVAKFRKLHRYVPRRIVTQGVEINIIMITLSTPGNRLLVTGVIPRNM